MLPKSRNLITRHRNKQIGVLESSSGSDLEDDLVRLENNLTESVLTQQKPE